MGGAGSNKTHVSHSHGPPGEEYDDGEMPLWRYYRRLRLEDIVVGGRTTVKTLALNPELSNETLTFVLFHKQESEALICAP